MLAGLPLIMERDTYGSLLYAVLGGLLLLATFHLAMYFQNRDRSYLLYSGYTFFSFLAYIPVTPDGFLHDLADNLNIGYIEKIYFTIVFNCIYFFFFSYFLNIKKFKPRWYYIITVPVGVLLSLATIAYLILVFFHDDTFFRWFHTAFVFLITIQTVISLVFLFKLPNKLKYYIITGGLILFFCSIIGQRFIRELPFINMSRKMGDFIYFLGLFIENIAFSFALGHKQRINYHKKVLANRSFIAQLRKNQLLNEEMNRENEKRLKLENEKIRIEQEISELKLTLLQTQMNPHFVFNALSSIKYYILDNDPEVAVVYLNKFSKIIRTILVASTMKEFTLQQELDTLQLYVDIENLRFREELDFQIRIDPKINCEEIKLPPLILQPFVENAIIHGVATVDDKKIVLKIEQKGAWLHICITDNGIGRKEASKSKTGRRSLGVEIVEGMLRNYFGAHRYEIRYTDLQSPHQAAGTEVCLRFQAP